ncbi:hypothetical protein BDZ94DRAFT_1324809 [Collybia nuda]|uniref:Uncharacterized protein n=1 Tax=Collybia nuda TaxID=64659 RepID=A0A9P5XZ49_9AGAR|nr:hypothetical protein BDZ94DRAFT_1324809 [Collybia nuda]
MPTPMNRLVTTPRIWARSIISSLKLAKSTRKKNRKATHLISIVTTQDTLSSPKKPTNPYDLSKIPQELYSREKLAPSTPTPPPVPPKDSYLLNLTTNKKPNPIRTEDDSEDIPIITLVGIDSPRVLFAPGTTFDRDITNKKLSKNHLCPPPRASLRRKRGTRQLPSLNITAHGHTSDNLPDPRRDGHNEILPLYPGLPTVLSINGGDCPVRIVKPLPEYRRDGARPTDVAVVEACGTTTHRVVFMGQNAFLIQVLDHITVPRLPAPPKQGSTQADLMSDLATVPRDGDPYNPGLYTDYINSMSLLVPTRSKGERGIPRPRTPSPAKFYDFQRATELSRSVDQPIVPQDIPQNYGYGRGYVKADFVLYDNTPALGINSIPFPRILSPPLHILDRSPLQEPLDFSPHRSILMKYQTHEEAIENIDSNHYPEPGQGLQPPIGTGRPLRLPNLTNCKPDKISGLTSPNPKESFSEAYGGMIETCHETEHGHTPRLPNSIWNL